MDGWCFLLWISHPFYLKRCKDEHIDVFLSAAVQLFVTGFVSVCSAPLLFLFTLCCWAWLGVCGYTCVFPACLFFSFSLCMNDSQGFFFGRPERTCASYCSGFLSSGWVRQAVTSRLGFWNIDEPKHQRTFRNNWFVLGCRDTCRVILKLALCHCPQRLEAQTLVYINDTFWPCFKLA